MRVGGMPAGARWNGRTAATYFGIVVTLLLAVEILVLGLGAAGNRVAGALCGLGLTGCAAEVPAPASSIP